MSIVREAKVSEVNECVKLLREFHKNSPMHNVSEYDEAHATEFLLNAIQESTMLVAVAEENNVLIGCVGAVLYPLYMNPKDTIVQELWWWLAPESRGSGAGKQLYTFIEDWAKNKNANLLFMIALEDERAAKMEKLYIRTGFKPMERTFFKELK